MIEGFAHAMQGQETQFVSVRSSLDIKIAIRKSNYLVCDMRYSSRTMVGIVGLLSTIVVMAKVFDMILHYYMAFSNTHLLTFIRSLLIWVIL